MILTAVLLWHLNGLARENLARRILVDTERVLQQFGIPEDKHEEILAPLHAFVARLRAGEASLREAQAVSDGLMDGVFFRVVPFMGFEARFLRDAPLPEPSLQAARRTVARFLHAVCEDQVDPLTLQSIQDLILANNDGLWHLNETMPQADREMTLRLMAEAVRAAPLDETQPEPPDLRTAIESVLEDARADATRGQPAPQRMDEMTEQGTPHAP